MLELKTQSVNVASTSSNPHAVRDASQARYVDCEAGKEATVIPDRMVE